MDAIGSVAQRDLIRERLWNFVQPEPMSGCWIWVGARTSRGLKYGHMRLPRSRRNARAHRLSYLVFVGPIPDGKEIDHFWCNTPACINPDHLKPASHRENVSKPTCKRGHLFSKDNTKMYLRNGIRHRVCRICARMRKRKEWQEAVVGRAREQRRYTRLAALLKE